MKMGMAMHSAILSTQVAKGGQPQIQGQHWTLSSKLVWEVTLSRYCLKKKKNKAKPFRDDKKPPSGREEAQWMQALVTGVWPPKFNSYRWKESSDYVFLWFYQMFQVCNIFFCYLFIQDMFTCQAPLLLWLYTYSALAVNHQTWG